jgi:hypothetical protein
MLSLVLEFIQLSVICLLIREGERTLTGATVSRAQNQTRKLKKYIFILLSHIGAMKCVILQGQPL